VLFSLINISRFIKVDPESALERTNKKFIRRFQYLEEATKAKGLQLDEMSLEEMDRYWDEAKAKGL
jgi:XTP/dITP diphosphohydrolase